MPVKIREMVHYCPECNIYGVGAAYSDGSIKIIRNCECGNAREYLQMYLKAPFEEIILEKRMTIPSKNADSLPITIEAGCRVILEKMPDGSRVIRNVKIPRRR